MEKIKTEVPLHFINDSPAVYTHNAVLLKNIEEIEVEALPANADIRIYRGKPRKHKGNWRWYLC